MRRGSRGSGISQTEASLHILKYQDGTGQRNPQAPDLAKITMRRKAASSRRTPKSTWVTDAFGERARALTAHIDEARIGRDLIEGCEGALRLGQ
jgi:hypothetical protein